MKQSGDIAHNKTGGTAARRQPSGDGLAEIKHPLTAIMTNADAARRWLCRTDPNFPEALAALDRIVKESARIDLTITDFRAAPAGECPGLTSAVLSSIAGARGA
jgi:hypothetical protein